MGAKATLINNGIGKSNEDLINEAKEFFQMYKDNLCENHHKKSIEVDMVDLAQSSPLLAEALYGNPEQVISILEEALSCTLMMDQNKKVRLKNLSSTNHREIHKIRAFDLNQIISVKGIIKRLTKVILRCESITYECSACGTLISILQPTRKIVVPHRCSCGNKGIKFNPRNTQVMTNIQELNLEEMQDELDGKQPQQLRVYLEGELTDNDFMSRLQPGKRIELIGIIQKLPEFMTPKDELQNITEFMMFANNILPLEADTDLTITPEDEMEIREIAANNPLEQLAASLVPEVYGNDVVKKAIVLQCMKGVGKEKSDGTFSREDINILLCGDVGVAKSVSLKAAVARTPKAKMVVGTKTSKVGLGAMAVKDELTQSWSLEVGALILCNGSMLAIDELDKMYKEHLNDLLEPMSAGTVTINKAGISACLPAKTSILASANPIYGNYDLSQALAKQIDLPAPILNRFDLIFVLIDRPNEEFDSNAVEHIFKSYKEKMVPAISTEMFKKYINYCKKLRPVLDDKLVNYFQEFYINLRKQSNKDGVKGIPVNFRNIEAIIKLSEAHAKLRLSDTVEIEDLNVAKDIFMFCLKQVGIDPETGVFDTSRMYMKIPTSESGKVKGLLEVMAELQEIHGKMLPVSVIIEAAMPKCNIKKFEVNNWLDRLAREGQIFEPRKGMYQLL